MVEKADGRVLGYDEIPAKKSRSVLSGAGAGPRRVCRQMCTGRKRPEGSTRETEGVVQQARGGSELLRDSVDPTTLAARRQRAGAFRRRPDIFARLVLSSLRPPSNIAAAAILGLRRALSHLLYTYHHVHARRYLWLRPISECRAA